MFFRHSGQGHSTVITLLLLLISNHYYINMYTLLVKKIFALTFGLKLEHVQGQFCLSPGLCQLYLYTYVYIGEKHVILKFIDD